ncbi:MAG: DUF3391 domain-containing protein [Rhodocyclaceae bacterium]|nr:DUF3391 domain-containing protein [Rhodocyclaceae bacterium]
MESEFPLINPEQLRVGVFVHLGVGWLRHPFPLSKFKIKTEEQVWIILGLGLGNVRWDPVLSDVVALPPGQVAASPEPVAPAVVETLAVGAQIAAKEARLETHKKHKAAYSGVSKAFHETALTVRSINRELFSHPQKTVGAATKLVDKLVDSFLSASDILLQVMGDKPGGEDQYLHGLNVSVLSLMAGRKLGLPAEACRVLGMGALFHDVGLTDVPTQITMKTDPLTRAEQEFRKQHCEFGLKAAQKVGLPPEVQRIIYSHHEFLDGSGYPQQLKGEAIPPLARIVAVVNYYDNLCNPVHVGNALTPHEALKLMYAQNRAWFDQKVLQTLIKALGVYPPGTLVKLSNEMAGVVTSVNSDRPLKPVVMLYDENVAPDDAPIIDLGEDSDVSIVKAMRPGTLPRAMVQYLCPRQRVSYYFDAGNSDERGGRT